MDLNPLPQMLQAYRSAPLARQVSPDGLGHPQGANAEASKAAKDFEAYYLFTAMQAMGKSTGLSGSQDQNSLETFQMFMHQHMAKAVAQAGGVGLADHITAELIKQQEAQ